MDRINVLHLIQGLEIGGLEIMAENLVKGLDPSIYRPSICCFDSMGVLAEDLGAKGIDIHLLKRNPGVDYYYPFRLARLLRANQTDILHLHNPTAFFYGTLAGKIANTPKIIYTEHGRDFSASFKVKISNRILAKMVDRIVVVADHGKKYLVEQEGVNGEKIERIYNGIDHERFGVSQKTEVVRRNLGLVNDQPVLGIVARLDPIKNHSCLIKAMKMVVKEQPTAILLVVGDGQQRSELENLTQILSLQNNVRFLGTRSDIPELLSALNVFVLPSFSEGLSLTLVEACASGIPIVATDVGGNKEVVLHDQNGLLVPSDHPEALGRAILRVLADGDKAQTMGKRGRQIFEESFTLKAMVKKYENLYESLF
ncbi:MAG: GT4 family glycosyltransferase PelF [Desulfuromonadales bacterium]|nr:GT4 family glycosyltransferase PelF [Desulfuromonadales bacterium]